MAPSVSRGVRCGVTHARWLGDLLAEEGLRAEPDLAGNNWITVPGKRPDTVIIGGHLDSVPNGGWLDGPLGVLAGARGTPPVQGRHPARHAGRRGLRRRRGRAFLAQPAGVVGRERQSRARQRARPGGPTGRAAPGRAGRERRRPGSHARGAPGPRPAPPARLPRAPHRARPRARGDGAIHGCGDRHLRCRAPRAAVRRPGGALGIDADRDAARRVPRGRRDGARLSGNRPPPLGRSGWCAPWARSRWSRRL